MANPIPLWERSAVSKTAIKNILNIRHHWPIFEEKYLPLCDPLPPPVGQTGDIMYSPKKAQKLYEQYRQEVRAQYASLVKMKK